MDTTSVSLLERLRQPADKEAWERFVRLYTPLLYHWARRLGLSAEDSADLVQDVLTRLVSQLPQFTYDPDKRFRGWLRTVTLNAWRDALRRRAHTPTAGGAELPQDLQGPDTAADFDEEEYRQFLVRRALQLMQDQFEPTTWKACWEYMIADRPAAEVAQELGITVNAVYLAKVRVLSRLRVELEGMLD
jgi:RNA polymerase sigma-70 factor (ECF subfamily)